MRFTVSSAALNSKLSMLSKVVASKSSLPILDCFLFQVANGEMTVTASDSDNSIKSTVSLTDCDGDGAFCIVSRTILNALRELPEQPLSFEINTDTYAVKIVYQNGMYNFNAESAEEYPLTKRMNDAASSVTIDANYLVEGIARSLFATANDELRPIMNGLYFDLTADSLNIVASDGHRLVRNRNFAIKSDMPASFSLPKKPASLLRSVLSKDAGDVTIKFDESSAEIEYLDGKISCRLIDGRYPNYNSVIPKDNPCEVTIDRKALVSTLRRILPFASESSQLVRFSIETGRVEVSSEDLDFSTSAREQISCDYLGSPMSIGFKGSTIQETLNSLTSDQVIIKLADPSRPGLIMPAEQPENEEVLMLVMPMLLND